jgi:hypothetical protein
LRCEEYRSHAVVVEACFLPRSRLPKHPTLLDVLRPEFHHWPDAVLIDNSVLADDVVDEKEKILRQGEEEKCPRRKEFHEQHQQTRQEFSALFGAENIRAQSASAQPYFLRK